LERNTITRRQILRGAGLVGVGTVLGASLGFAGARRGSEGGGAGSERPWYELGIIGEPVMDNQLLWYLSHTGQGMADIGECLDTAGRIDAADANSWPEEWLGTAEEFSPGQAKKLYDALQCPKDYMLFTEADTGLVHCQAGAPSVASQRMFDWLDEHI
jgi:hypothetical protein